MRVTVWLGLGLTRTALWSPAFVGIPVNVNKTAFKQLKDEVQIGHFQVNKSVKWSGIHTLFSASHPSRPIAAAPGSI